MIDRLRDQLIIDEGIEYKMYLDSEGRPTMGIGHLITKEDPEFHHIKDMATKTINISKERVRELFNQDIDICIVDCEVCFTDFKFMAEELQLIIANMMFNLGRSKFLGFKKFIKAVKRRDYEKAAKEMKNSLWYIQVKSRAERLILRMQHLALCEVDPIKIKEMRI